VTTIQNGLCDAPPRRPSLDGWRPFASLRPLALCLPRRLGDVLPNRATSEMFRDVAPCSAMSHHVALFSLYTKTASFFHIAEAVPLCLLLNSGPMCVGCARTRISRAPTRELQSSPAPRDAFRCRNVRQCAVMCANFSREAFPFKNSSCHQKSLWTHFLAMILCDLFRVISSHLDLSRVISTDFIYARATGPMRQISLADSHAYLYGRFRTPCAVALPNADRSHRRREPIAFDLPAAP